METNIRILRRQLAGYRNKNRELSSALRETMRVLLWTTVKQEQSLQASKEALVSIARM